MARSGTRRPGPAAQRRWLSWRRTPIAIVAVTLVIAALSQVCLVKRDDDSDGGLQVTVMALDTLRFDPAELRMQAGKTVRLTLDNTGSKTLHDFTVEGITARNVQEAGSAHHHMDGAPGLHVAADAGKRPTLSFVVDAPGEYVFFCSVPGHAEGGMTGMLIVTDPG